MPRFQHLFNNPRSLVIEETTDDTDSALLQIKDKLGNLLFSFNKDGTIPFADSVITSGNKYSFASTMFNPPVGNRLGTVQITSSGKGTGVTGEGIYSLGVLVQDAGGVVNKAITGAANNGSGLIRITCTGHTFSTGDRIAVYGVGGTTEANGTWIITVISANTFDLQGSAFSHAYTSGGTATNRPYMIGVFSGVIPSLTRGGTGANALTGTAANADDVNAFVAANSASGALKATDAFYVANNTGITGPQWDHAFSCDAKIDIAAFQFTNDLTGSAAEGSNAAMIDLGHATASGGGYAMRLPNSIWVAARNAANTADVLLYGLDSSNTLQIFSGMKWAESMVVQHGTSTGTYFGFNPATEKFAFWGATPITRPNTTGTATGFTAGAGTTVTHLSTFTGNTGSTAYTIGDIVNALKRLGLIAP